MTKLSIVAAFSIFAVSAGLSAIATAAEDPVPCEDMLADVKAALQSATLSDADKAKVENLESQGLERCKADDDAGADALFAQALAVMGK